MKGMITTVVVICSLFLGMRGYAQGESPDVELLVADLAASDSLYMFIGVGDDCARTLARLIDKGHRIREVHGAASRFQSLAALQAVSSARAIIFYSLTAYWPPTSVVLTCGLFSECNDEEDNDEDGFVDCDDSDCVDSPFCDGAK